MMITCFWFIANLKQICRYDIFCNVFLKWAPRNPVTRGRWCSIL